MLLLTDNQIVNDSFLVYINDLLASGDIPGLCTEEERDTFCNAVSYRIQHVFQSRAGWLYKNLDTFSCCRYVMRSRQLAWLTVQKHVGNTLPTR